MKRAGSRFRPKVFKRVTKHKKKGGTRLLPNRSDLIKVLDSLISTFVRNEFADANNLLVCYTCDFTGTVKTLQCGHYISRFFKNTRWLLDNLRPQCFMCNMRLGGCGHIFRAKLVAELGEARVVEMEQLAKEDFNQDDDWLVQQILNANQLCTMAGYSLPANTVRKLSKITRVVEAATFLYIFPTQLTNAHIHPVVSSMD